MKRPSRWLVLGASLLASPAIFFVVFAIFDSAHPEDRKPWLTLAAITVAISTISLLRNVITGVVAVIYAGLLTLFLLGIGTTHPVLIRLLICMALGFAVVAGAFLVGVNSFRRS
jgi:hypothetical protein